MRIMQVKRFFKYFGIGIAILVGVILVAGQIAYYSVPIIDAPGKMYSVNGKEIHMYCTGPESDTQPTIIIISGGGTPSYVYNDLRENLSKTIRACSYDIAGFGWSESNGIPSTAENMSYELYQLLQAAQIDGSIILAGHSLGGLVSLIYSAEHEEQVAGIAFIDSSHYNQVDYFGKEFREHIDKSTDEFLENFWLIELGSRLGVMNLMNIITHTSESEEYDENHQLGASLDRQNPPYSAMKSVVSNLNLSFEQAKEVHYTRGNLPIIAIAASDVNLEGFPGPELSEKEMTDIMMSFHKDLSSLSDNGKFVIVNGTDHISIVYEDETAEHILSLVPLIEEIKNENTSLQ